MRDVATGKDLPDKVQWAKFSGHHLDPGQRGFYYTRFPRPGSVPAGDENYSSQIYFHRLGDGAGRRTRSSSSGKDRKEILWTRASPWTGVT